MAEIYSQTKYFVSYVSMLDAVDQVNEYCRTTNTEMKGMSHYEGEMDSGARVGDGIVKKPIYSVVIFFNKRKYQTNEL